MRSYCHEVLADGGGLQSFWGADVPACWDCVVQTGFRWAQQASGASGKSQAYAKGLFHQQPLWWKMGFFFVWRNFLENIVALFGCAKQQLTSSKGDRISWSKGLPGLQQLLFPLRLHLSLLQQLPFMKSTRSSGCKATMAAWSNGRAVTQYFNSSFQKWMAKSKEMLLLLKLGKKRSQALRVGYSGPHAGCFALPNANTLRKWGYDCMLSM